MSALAELGLNVPADVAVAGYDDLAIARHLNPPLTTVRQDRSRWDERLSMRSNGLRARRWFPV